MTDFFSDIGFFLNRLDWLSVIDLLLVMAIFFLLFSLVRGTQAVALLRGMVLLVIAIALLTAWLTLPAFSWLLRAALSPLLIAIPVIFAPEIRRALERLGRAGALLTPHLQPAQIRRRIDAVCSASQRLADHRYGALIVIERETHLDEFAETGVRLDAELSAQLLMQIFFINTPLHDGAVIIRDDRLVAAGCVLPLSASGSLSRSIERQMGLRHRAALGISEVSDAIVVVVSEEAGVISVALNGRMIRRLDQSRLRSVLIAFYRPRAQGVLPVWIGKLLMRLSSRQDDISGD
ncbi:MAG: diadenylate cyclase CdaA [Anaerolineales bacterium]